MIVDCGKLVNSVDVDDVQLVTVGDLLNLDRVDGLQGGLDEFERRYPSIRVSLLDLVSSGSRVINSRDAL